jgi:protein transport protein SEC61 subunit gamma-like protein
MDEQKKPAEQIPTEPLPDIIEEEIPAEVVEEPQQVAQPTQAYIPRSGATPEEAAKPSKWGKFKEFITECKRVVRVTKKPGKDEFKTIVKISGIGMAVIGFLGFFVHFVKELLF